jgi:TM2 domain-containing membrane protein YozV
MSTASGGRGKNKMVAGLLALFVGSLGVHHFYLGSSMAGVVTIVACCGLSGILPLVEAIMLLTMSDSDFDAKYNARTPEPMEFVFMKK